MLDRPLDCELVDRGVRGDVCPLAAVGPALGVAALSLALSSLALVAAFFAVCRLLDPFNAAASSLSLSSLTLAAFFAVCRLLHPLSPPLSLSLSLLLLGSLLPRM